MIFTFPKGTASTLTTNTTRVLLAPHSFDPLGLGPRDDPAAWKDMQTKELNNGRLACVPAPALVHVRLFLACACLFPPAP